MKLCEYEIEVLRAAAGEHVLGLHWGAAMGQALEVLQGHGLIARNGNTYEATDKGKLELASYRCVYPEGRQRPEQEDRFFQPK